MYTNEHNRAVNQKTDPDQHGNVDARVAGRVKPVDQNTHERQGQINNTGGCASSAKNPVGQITTQQGARNAGPFIHGVGPARFFEGESLDLIEVGGRPVQYAITDQVDKSVGDCDRPQQTVIQHMPQKYFACRKLLFMGIVIGKYLGVIIFMDFDGR